MGEMTTITFLKDDYDIIEKNPKQVIDNILIAMNNKREQIKIFSVGNSQSAMTSVRTHRESSPQLILVHQSATTALGDDNDLIGSRARLEARKRQYQIAVNILKNEKRLIEEEEKKIKTNE